MTVLRRTIMVLICLLPLGVQAMSFDTAVSHVFRYENGYAPYDPSKYGITQETLERADIGVTDLHNLTREQARGIYKRLYWDRIQADKLPDGLDFAVFDFAVQFGVDRAVRTLQNVVGVRIDGIMGPKTLEAASQAPVCDIIHELNGWRAYLYGHSERLHRFWYGWHQRLLHGHEVAIQRCGRASG